MLTIPYSGHSGESVDRVLRGRLPVVAPTTVLNSAHMTPFGKVYRGNAAADGSVTWSDATAAALGSSFGVTIFDVAVPTVDQLCIEVAEADVLTGIGLMISQAAVLSGTPAAELFYRSPTGWITVPGVVTPSLLSPGLVMVTFSLAGSAIALTDDEIDRRNNPPHRCAFLRFGGITAVTTPLVCSRIYKRLSHAEDHSAQDVTSVFAQGASPTFSSQQALIQPIQDDLLLFGFDELPLQLLTTMYRPSAVPTAQREWVYSRVGGFAALSTAALDDPSTRFGAVLTPNPIAHQLINLTSTYAAGTWGNSGIASTQTLAGDGYVEFKVGASPALAAMVGFSESNANANYTSIGWAVHVGHGATAFASWWRNGVQQAGGTTPIVTGDVLRLERSGGTISAYKNDVLIHTFTATTTAPLLVDAAFIFSAAVTDLVLVNRSVIPEVPVAIVWKDNVAVTVANGGTKAFGIVTVHRISVVPPIDMAKRSVLGAGSANHSHYWIGLRQTADAASAVLPENVTMRALVAKGAGARGVPADQSAYTHMSIVRHPAPGTDAVMTVVNTTTGKLASVTLPAGETTAHTTVVLSDGAVGDEFASLRSRGPELDDSVVYLW